MIISFYWVSCIRRGGMAEGSTFLKFGRKKRPLHLHGRELAFNLSKNRESQPERVEALSSFQSRPAACTVGAGRFLRRKISFSRAKIVSLQFLRPEIRRILAKTGEGGSGGGACFPVHTACQKSFLTSCERQAFGLAFFYIVYLELMFLWQNIFGAKFALSGRDAAVVTLGEVC